MDNTAVAAWETKSFIELRDYREVEEVLKRGRDFVVSGTKAGSEEFVHGTLMGLDGREHLQRRRSLMKMLGPRQPWGAEGNLFEQIFEQNIGRVLNLADPSSSEIHFDLIDFARRVTWQLTAALVGLDGVDDDDQVARLKELATPVLRGLTIEYLPAEQHEAVLSEAREARDIIRREMFEPSLERRKALVRDAEAVDALPADLLTSLVVAAGDDEPDAETIFREMVALLAAAINNPVSQTAWALDNLLEWLEKHPEDATRVNEREFINSAVKETLRLHRTSRPHLLRIATGDVVLESTGRRIPAGSWVSSWVEDANHDVDVFGSDSHLYDPYRAKPDHADQSFGIAFGAGPHVCIGRPMLLWEQGEEDAQGALTKMLRLLLSLKVARDGNGVHELVGEEGGRRFEIYDVVMPRPTTDMISPPPGCPAHVAT